VLQACSELTSDEGFIRLDMAREFIRRRHAEGHANAVVREPRGLLPNTDGP